MPDATNTLRFKNDRVTKFYVSMNDGVDWTTEDIVFTFLDEP